MRKTMKTMVFFTAVIFFCLLPPQPSAGDEKEGEAYLELRKQISVIVKGTGIKGAEAGIHVMEVESGGTIYALKEKKALNPASGIKLLTAYSALYHLGPEFKFKTSMYADGRKKGTVKNVYLKGSGDPSFEDSHLRDMVALLVEKGVREVEGDIIMDGSCFDDEKLPYGFDHYPKSDEESAFRAPVGGVSINGNTLRIRVIPGAAVGSPAVVSVFPEGYVELTGKAVTAKPGKHDIKISTCSSGEKMKVKVWGSVSINYRGGAFYRRAEDPTMLAGYSLRQLLSEKGIKVKGDIKKGKVPSAASLMARHISQPLSSILLKVGKRSRNFFAEQILKVIGAEVKGKPGTTQKGSEATLELLEKAGVETSGIKYRNGSGLYDANFIPASAVTKLLRFAYLSPEYRPEFLSQLAVGGVDGTLKKRLNSAGSKRHVRAKTGTLKGVTSLSGYVIAPAGGKTLCFSILVNKAGGRIGDFRAMQDKIVGQIAKYLYRDYN